MATSGLAPQRAETGVTPLESRPRGVIAAIYSARWFRVGLCLLGVAAAPLIFEPIVRSDGLGALDRTMVLYILIPWAFVVSGFIAWDRRPGNPMGAFMLVLGLAWIVGNLMTPPTTSSSLLFTAGTIVRIAWFLGFVFVLLSFPHGRLSGWPDQLLVGAMFVSAVPLQIAWLLFWERPQPPMNAFLVWPSDQTADLLEGAQSVGLWAVSAELVGLTVIRWRSGGWPRRRALVPVLAGGLTLLAFSGWVVAVEFWGTQTSWR